MYSAEFRLSTDQSQAELMIGNYTFLSSFAVVVGYIRPVDGVRLKSNSLARVQMRICYSNRIELLFQQFKRLPRMR